MNLPEKEKAILAYWRENKIFEKTLAKTLRLRSGQAKKGKPFVFYEGPPYANGKPGIHHVLARAFKDIILRFKTMQGFYVARKAGWDTHGLPTEMEVEKKLGVQTKKEIEKKIGIENFVEEARKNVFFYKEEWERLTERMAYWLDLEYPYVTMTNDYIEGLWRVFSQIAKNGYLYKDYKVLPWCPRCETSLSSHELAQGYKKIKEDSVYVKFPIKQPASQNSKIKAYFLAWTTTPWTLPGNTALAVNPKAKYATIETNGEWLILARERLSVINGEHKMISEETGDRLIGVEYEPLYKSQITNHKSQIYRVVGANFVSTDDGTGIVHIAPAFGAEDQKAGKEHGLPTLVTVGEDGRMQTPGMAWHEKTFLEANPLIIKNLEARKLLYKIEPYEHDYPFCWRCKSALMYCAKDSWFLKTTAVKKRMIEENKKINWHPKHVGEARFGAWLKENVDWAISRERYWGMPLPIWICSGCGFQDVVGSLKELDDKRAVGSAEVFVMRHGEATHNVRSVVGPAIAKYDRDNHLTPKGRKQVKEAAIKLKKEKLEFIISSPLTRAKETAEIISNELKIGYIVNDQLFDINVGDLHGRKIEDVNKEFPIEKRFSTPFPNGENWRDVRARMMKALRGIISENSEKKVLIISHGDPLWILNAALDGVREDDYRDKWYPKTAEIKKLRLHNWPYSLKRGELDLHKPFIDEIILGCPKCAKEMRRVSSVADVWYDSGSMPYAQWAEVEGGKLEARDKKLDVRSIGKNIPYPADYICEAMDQTRGWFYTLLAVASLLELPAPFKNVIVNGLLLDEKGEKMSKSRGNIVEPFKLFDSYGADAVRWYFFTINQPWDDKLFREEDVKNAARKFLMILVNSVEYWKTYKTANRKSQIANLIINKWLIAKLGQVKSDTTKALENYDVVKAARAIENFVIEDISHWYIRRIRDIMKTGKVAEKRETSAVFGYTLLELAKILAPFVPFVAENVYRDLGGREKSAHLEEWPKINSKFQIPNPKLLKDMDIVRGIVSEALELRARAGIKVRQPLLSLKIKSSKFKVGKDFLVLIRGEVNVKNVIFDSRIKNEIELDTKITPDLKEEGALRELIRQVQNMRKKTGLQPKDKIVLEISGNEKFIKKFSGQLKKETGAKAIASEVPNPKLSSELKVDEFQFKITI